MEPEADVALQGCRGQPLLGEAALEEGDAGAEVGQAVHPAGDLLPAQDLSQSRREVITVLVHQMVRVAFVLLAQFFHNLIHIFFCEVCGAQGNGFFEFKGLAKLYRTARCDLENPTERVGMPSIGKLSAVDLDARVEDTNPQGGGVFIYPVLTLPLLLCMLK